MPKDKKKQREKGLSTLANIIGKVLPTDTVVKRKKERKRRLEELAKLTKTKVGKR